MKSHISIIMLFCANVFFAQNGVDFYKNKYPNANEVIIKQYNQLEINVGNNGIDVLAESACESMVLTDDVNKVSTKGSVTFSAFNQIQDIEASTEYLNKKYHVKEFRIVPDKQSRSFHDDTKIKEFDYVQLGTGAIKRLNYTSILTEPKLISGELFIENYPVEYKELKLIVDKNIDLGYKIFNNENKVIQFSQEEKGNKIIYRWFAKDIPQYKHEEGMPSILYFVPIVEIYIKSYKNKKGEKISVLNSLDDLHKLYQEYTKDVYEKPSDELVQKAQELKTKQTTEIDQVKEIYYWVKDNVKYIAFEDGYGGFIPRKPNDVFHKRYGDCKDMAVVIYTMLKSVGLNNVYLTWIGSRDKPFRYDELPTQAVDDHMIATYKYQDKDYFLDGTSKDTPFGFPSSFIQGKQAFLHKSKDVYELAMVPVMESENSVLQQETSIILDNQKVKGTSSVQFTGFYRDTVLAMLEEDPGEQQTEFLKGFLELGNNKFNLSAHELSDRANRDKPFEIKYAFDVDNYIVSADNEMYINLFLQKMDGFREITAKRKVDFHSDNKFQIRQKVKFTIPKGYKVNYVPENKNIANELYNFDIKYTTTATEVVLEYALNINYIELKKEKIENWNTFVNQCKENMAESISILKI